MIQRRRTRVAGSPRPLLFALVLIVSLAAAPALATQGTVRQLTDELTVAAGPGALDDAGTSVFTGSTANTTGGNPRHASQLVAFDVATLLESALTAFDDGVLPIVSVSDDGAWIVFISPSDPLGTNHDQSAELFVVAGDGTGLAQLTSDTSVIAGSVLQAVISGDGARVAFTANTDPLGTNPSNVEQVFIVDRDGGNLAQLTALTEDGIGGLAISDDAARLVFAHAGDPLATNPDLGSEVFAVNGDGTGLRQLTATPATFGSGAPVISGNGALVAFQSAGDLTGGNPAGQTEIFKVNWDGTGLGQVTTTSVLFGFTGDPTAAAPSITDDASKIYYYSNFNSFTVNLDGNFEIFRINPDGTGRELLTSSFLDAGSLLPVVSGSGNRMTYINVGTQVTLAVDDAAGGNQQTLIAYDTILNAQPALAPGGERVVFVRSPSLFGGDQLWSVNPDGSDLAQVTTLTGGGAASPSIAEDATTIVFSADSDPLTTNADLSEEIFLVQADGSGLAQLTSAPTGSACTAPVIAADGSRVVFDCNADLAGGNADLSREIFTVLPDGTGLAQLTSGPLGTASQAAAVDGSGTWIAFESTADPLGTNADGSWEIFRMRTDGTALAQLTADGTLNSRSPDISEAGDLVAFHSPADLAGTNPEGNAEVFLWQAAGSSLSQVTSYAGGASTGARLSGDGSTLWFLSDAPVFEDDPDAPVSLYIVPTGGGMIRRAGALGFGAPGVAATGRSGSVAAFSGAGDNTGRNKDALPEIWYVDREGESFFTIGAAAPTLLSWTASSGAIRYDVIRGDVANISVSVISITDLGPVACLENDSPDTDTAGFEDPAQPVPGQAFFYLCRGSEGLNALGASYGTASNLIERLPASGDCPQ